MFTPELVIGVLVTSGVWLGGVVVLASRYRATRRRWEDAHRRAAVLELEVRTDPLTGVLNRRGLDEALGREWSRACRDREPIAVLVVDLDGFKQVNDHWGHPTGDRVLTTIAARLAGAVSRPGDAVGRLGGDEFLVLLAGADLQGARTVAQRVVHAVAEPVWCGDHGRSLTVFATVGLACERPRQGGSVAALISAADQDLVTQKVRQPGNPWQPEPNESLGMLFPDPGREAYELVPPS